MTNSINNRIETTLPSTFSVTAVVIKKNEYDEFELPTSECGKREIYFTDDKQDAIDTAHFVFGDELKISFRRGTYGE